MATIMDMSVAKIVVGTIPAGSSEPAVARNATTLVGSNVSPAVLMARNSTIALEAVPLTGFSLFSSSMALMPKGVAALPSPSRLADMFMIIAPIAGCSAGTSGNRRVIMGFISRAIIRNSPAFSTMRIRPRKSAITPISPHSSANAAKAKSE